MAAASGEAGKRTVGSGREEVTVTLPNGTQAKAYRIAIPDSKVQSGIAVLWDRYTGSSGGHTLPVGAQGAEAAKAEAFLARVEGAVKGLASSTEGRELLEGIGRMRPIDVATGKAKPAFGNDTVTTLFYRGMPADEQQWPDALKRKLKEAEEADKALADDLRQNAVVSEPVANAIDRSRASNSNGSEGMVAMPDEAKVFFGYLPDGKRIAIHESQLVGHELVHVGHYLQGTLLDGPRWKVEVEVPFTAADGSRKTAKVVIAGEEVRTLGGNDARTSVTTVASSGGKSELRMAFVDESEKAIGTAIKNAPDEATKTALQKVQHGRGQTYLSSETRLAEENNWSARPHYDLPAEEMAKAWGKTRAEVAGEFVTVPPDTSFTIRELKDPQALRDKLEKAGEKTGKKLLSSAVRACSRYFGRGRESVWCSADGRPEEVTQETHSRTREVRGFLEEHPDARVQLPSAAGDITREEMQRELVAFHGVKPGDVDRVLEGVERHGTAGNNERDWKGFYLAENESHAAGYTIGEDGMSAGGVVKVKLQPPFTLATVDMVKEVGETEEQFDKRRVKRIKEEFQVKADDPMVDSLAKDKVVLKLKDGTTDAGGAERYELIVPWEMAQGNKPELVQRFNKGTRGVADAEAMMAGCPIGPSLAKRSAGTARAKGSARGCTEIGFVQESADILDTLRREGNVAEAAKSLAEAAHTLENSEEASAQVREKAKAVREKLVAAVSGGKVNAGKLAEANKTLTQLAESLDRVGKPVMALAKTLDREPARAQAVAEGKKLPGRARERAKELCAKSGTASCVETVDWEQVRREARAVAERLVEKKLAGIGEVSEIKLSKDMKASLKDPATFYVPYEKTRGKLANPAGDLAWERVKSAGGAGMYLLGLYQAFSGDSTDLDKGAAIAALIPAVGDILGLAVDLEHKDYVSLGVDAAASLAGLLETAGVEGIGGPAFAVAMVYHLGAQAIAADFQRYDDVKNAVAERDIGWHDALMKYLQDPEKGWLSKEGGTQVVAMAIGFLQAVELQRASVKATAHAATATVDGGAYTAPKTGDWARTDASKNADAAVDTLTDKTPDIVRQAAAKSIADGMNAAWNEKQGKEFNQAYIDRVSSIQLGIWCGRSMPDGSNPCYESSQKMRAGVLENLKKNPPAGVTAEEVEDVLKNFGLTGPGFLPLGHPFRLSTTSDGAQRYLHFDIENEKANHAKDATDPTRQEFFFRTTGRITDLEGGLCMAGGKKAGDPVTVNACTHRNAPEQRWQPDDKGRIKNLATGQYLDSGEPDGYVTTWSGEDGTPARQTWKAEEPARSMTPQTGNDAISKLLSAPGSSHQIDGVVPNQAPNSYYLFSGANILSVSTSSNGGDLKLSPGEVKKTTEHWEGLAPLFAASRDTRITAGMKVPRRPGELYLFSGDKYARLGTDGKIINEPRSIEDNWATLKGLFAKSGVKRVDAIRPIPGVEDCFQFFSGAYSNQVCLNNDLEDRETGPVQRNAERWPEIGANTGKDEVHGFLQVPGKPMANHIFTGDQFTHVDRSVLPAKPDVQFEVSTIYSAVAFAWNNGKGLAEGTKIVVERSGDISAKAEFDPSPGKLPDGNETAHQLIRLPTEGIFGTNSYTMTAHYRYIHPDGSEEISGQWSQGYWCSMWKCDYS
ncbi:hypothetical protein BG418_34515 [Streptomyces sp. CBMA152]|nr:hypothetical protein [Streptomyces sp. CBMA152]